MRPPVFVDFVGGKPGLRELLWAAFAFSGLCLVFVVSVFDKFFFLYFPACTDRREWHCIA